MTSREIGNSHNYVALDGMRGIAALAVLSLHAQAFFRPIALPSGYLAVDLFFVLSGFVLAHAYEARFSSGMTTGKFMLLRWVRLYPLYLLGLALGSISGALALILGGGDLSVGGFLRALVSALFMLPSPTWDENGGVFPLNVPTWSLFFELAVNLVYVLFYRWLTIRVVAAVIGASAIILAAEIVTHGNADLGSAWSSFSVGFPRVTFSFFVGVLLRRYSAAAPTVTPVGWIPPLLLVPLFAVNAPERAIIDLVAVTIAFPSLVWVSSRIQPAQSKIFLFLGATSYGLYVLHYPLFEICRRSLHFLHANPELAAPWLGIAFVGALLVAAWWVDLNYDRPARKLLSRFLSAREFTPGTKQDHRK